MALAGHAADVGNGNIVDIGSLRQVLTDRDFAYLDTVFSGGQPAHRTGTGAGA